MDLTKLPESPIYTHKSEDLILKQIVRQTSFLGELEKRICRTLDITKPWQHELSYPDETNFENAKKVETGNLTFAKENSSFSGTRLKNIRDTLKSVYEGKGFIIKGKDIEKEKTPEGLSVPKDYYQNTVLIVEKGNQKYQINIWQGGEYIIHITDDI